jgi:putative inorganic carbon (HCO3(-)) transporter
MQHFPPQFMSFISDKPLSDLPSWTRVFSFTDEISFVVFSLIVFTFWAMKPATFKFPCLPLTKWIMIFIVYAFIVGLAKRIPLTQATFGIYDHIKNLVILYLFAMMAFNRDEFISLLRSLIIIGLILAVVGIIGMFLAFTLGQKNLLVMTSGRFIPYQTYSLAGHGKQNYLGVYATLLFFLSYTFKEPIIKFSRANIFFLLVFTVSRQAWMSFVAIFSFFKRKKVLIVGLPILFLLIVISMGQKLEMNPEEYFRLFAFLESLRILKEHPLTGVGPGMFGGLASVIWQSPIYEKWPPLMYWWVYRIRAIDSFWPVIWGELGIIGFSLFVGGMLSLFFYLKRLAATFSHLADFQLSLIGRTLQWFMIALVIMGFAGGWNCPFVTYTYFALVGIYVSLHEEAISTAQG